MHSYLPSIVTMLDEHKLKKSKEETKYNQWKRKRTASM